MILTPSPTCEPLDCARPIYLDHQATTPVDPRVAAVVLHAMTTAFGNPRSADHAFGDVAQALVEAARADVATLVACEPRAVHFTSGASESMRLAVNHAARTVSHRTGRPARIAASPVEHRAVLGALEAVQREGRATVAWLAVDQRGRLDLSSLDGALAHGADIVCVMAANNEVGNVYPIDAVTARAARAGALALIDATQAVGKVPIRMRDWGATYLALSAHKIYGPKGVGALVVHAPPRAFREDEVPDGTPNVPGIVGLGEACRLRRLEMAEDEVRIAALRDRLERALRASVPGLVVNGDPEYRVAGSLHVAAPSAPNDAVIARVRDRLAISTGAACTSGAETPSHVLVAMELPPGLQEGALRIGLGKFTTTEEVDAAAALVSAAILAVRQALGSADFG